MVVIRRVLERLSCALALAPAGLLVSRAVFRMVPAWFCRLVPPSLRRGVLSPDLAKAERGRGAGLGSAARCVSGMAGSGR